MTQVTVQRLVVCRMTQATVWRLVVCRMTLVAAQWLVVRMNWIILPTLMGSTKPLLVDVLLWRLLVLRWCRAALAPIMFTI